MPNRIEKINKVKTIAGRRKAIRNFFRKSRSLIGKGFKKVKGSKRIVRMSQKERRKYNPLTNIKIRKALQKRKIRQRLINLKRKKTLKTGIYKTFAKKRKK
jgi:hypothetical protein